MRSPRLFSALLVSFLIATILASTAPPVSGQVYVPGVKPGDWLFYGEVYGDWNVSFIQPISPFQDFIQANSVRAEVQIVDGSNITALQTWDLKNQTEPRNVTIIFNVQTGPETLMIPWFTAGGLTAGDKVYDDPQAPSINQTLSKTYAGAPRLVNLLNTTQSFPGYSGVYFRVASYWDQLTGAALEFSLTGYFFGVSSASIHFKATDTSLWQNPLRPDFTLHANPASLTVQQGSSHAFTLNLTNTAHVPANVTVRIQTTPEGPNLQPANWTRRLQIRETILKTITLLTDIDTPAGNYTITVTAKAGSVTRTARLSLEITPSPTFEIIPSENTLTLRQGSSYTFTVNIVGKGGFTGVVKLNTTVSPSGPAATLFQDSVSISSSGSGTTALTIMIPLSSSTQAYLVTVTGTGGGRTVTATVLLEVRPAANAAASATILGLTPYQFAISVSLILLVGSSFFLFRRRLSRYWPLLRETNAGR